MKMDGDSKKLICRACLSVNKPSKTVSVFKQHYSFIIHNEITALTKVIIDENDGFPDHLCLGCLNELETAVKFKSKCEASDTLLRNSLAKSESSKSLLRDILSKSHTRHKNYFEAALTDIKKEEDYDKDAFDDHFEVAAEDNFEAFGADGSEAVVEHQFEVPCKIEKPIKEDKSSIKELIRLSLNTTDKGNVQCDLCKSFFKSKCKLKVHFKKEHIPRTYTCTTCKKVFKSFKTFQKHEGRNDCEKFTLKEVRIEGVGRNRMYYCHVCPYKSDRMVHMRNHVVVHTKEKPFKCNLCNASYTQRGNLYHHKYMKHDNAKVIFPCDRCGKVLYSKPHLRRHLKTHTDPAHECPVCKKKFKLKEGLRVHMVRHKGEKNYSCETCGNSFFTHAELCNHRKYHLSVKRYTCDLCQYATQRKDTLLSHRSKHSPENPYVCIICGRVYPTLQKLEFHHAMHSKEKEVHCPFCDKKFLQKRSLKKHLAKKHENQVDAAKTLVKHLVVPKKEDNDNPSLFVETKFDGQTEYSERSSVS